MNHAKDHIVQAGEELKEAVKDTGEAGKLVLESTAEQVKEGFKDVKDKASDWMERGKETVQDTYEKGKETVQDTYEKGKERVYEGVKQAQDTAYDAAQKGKETYERGKERVYEGARQAQDAAYDTAQKGKEAYERGKDRVYEGARQAQDTAYDTAYKGKNAYERGKDRVYEGARYAQDAAYDTMQKGKDRVAQGAWEAQDTLRQGFMEQSGPKYTHDQWRAIHHMLEGGSSPHTISGPEDIFYMPHATVAYTSLFTCLLWLVLMFRKPYSRIDSVSAYAEEINVPRTTGPRHRIRSRGEKALAEEDDDDTEPLMLLQEQIVTSKNDNLFGSVPVATILLNILSLLMLGVLESSGMFRMEVIHTFLALVVGAFTVQIATGVWYGARVRAHDKWPTTVIEWCEAVQVTTAALVGLWCFLYAVWV